MRGVRVVVQLCVLACGWAANQRSPPQLPSNASNTTQYDDAQAACCSGCLTMKNITVAREHCKVGPCLGAPNKFCWSDVQVEQSSTVHDFDRDDSFCNAWFVNFPTCCPFRTHKATPQTALDTQREGGLGSGCELAPDPKWQHWNATNKPPPTTTTTTAEPTTFAPVVWDLLEHQMVDPACSAAEYVENSGVVGSGAECKEKAMARYALSQDVNYAVWRADADKACHLCQLDSGRSTYRDLPKAMSYSVAAAPVANETVDDGPGECKQWCERHYQPWSKKCGLPACAGCEVCTRPVSKYTRTFSPSINPPKCPYNQKCNPVSEPYKADPKFREGG